MADEDFAQRRALEDEWIAVRCQLGERAAFDELIERWHGPIWQYVRRLSDDDVAETSPRISGCVSCAGSEGHEIGQALDIPIGTVKSRLHRARRMLRRELSGKGDDS